MISHKHSHSRGRPVWRSLAIAALCAGGIAALTGCPKAVAPAKPMVNYQTIGADPNLPPYLKGTIKEITIVQNIGTFPVSSWGLVTELRRTGDTTAPTIVREWMIKEMQRHGFGMASKGYANVTTEQMLNDTTVAIAAVVANIPPGARKGDYVDVSVQAMPGNNTTSLANGKLWRASLRINGASSADPYGPVNEFAKAQGNIFVNPAYALAGAPTQASAMSSLRTGSIPHGGIVTTDRPIHLNLRFPSWSTSQALERRLDQLFQSVGDVPKKSGSGRLGVAEAVDEGYIHVFIPKAYHGNWKHFIGVAPHAFLNTEGGLVGAKAKQPAE